MNIPCTSPAYQVFPRDLQSWALFLEMTDEELGFFWRCLNFSWVNFGLPFESFQIARVLRTSRRKVERLWQTVGKCFEVRDGKWFCPQLEAQRSAQHEKSQKARESAQVRWKERAKQPDANAYANALLPSASATAIPDTATSEESTGIEQLAAAVRKPPGKETYPETRKLIASCERFSDVTQDFVEKLVEKAQAVDPEISDERLCQAIRATFKGAKQDSAGLFFHTVPAWLENNRRATA